MQGIPLSLTLRRGALETAEGHSTGLKGVVLFSLYEGRMGFQSFPGYKISKVSTLSSKGNSKNQGKPPHLLTAVDVGTSRMWNTGMGQKSMIYHRDL
jgi:hypothetical protein